MGVIAENIQKEKQGQYKLTQNFSEPRAGRLTGYLIKWKPFTVAV